jgi:hypothetical protein
VCGKKAALLRASVCVCTFGMSTLGDCTMLVLPLQIADHYTAKLNKWFELREKFVDPIHPKVIKPRLKSLEPHLKCALNFITHFALCCLEIFSVMCKFADYENFTPYAPSIHIFNIFAFKDNILNILETIPQYILHNIWYAL